MECSEVMDCSNDDTSLVPASSEPTAWTLITLPPEILHHICSFLRVKDVRLFRLVCRKLGSIGACHALPEVIFYLHKADLDALLTIAHHPVYPTYVRSLVYVADTLDPDMLSLKQYTAARRGRERRARTDHRRLYTMRLNRIYPRGVGKLERSPSPVQTPEQIKASFKEYKRVWAQQKQMLDKRTDFAVLRDVIARLQNLDEIEISSNDTFRDTYDTRTPFDDLACHAHSFLRPECVRQFESVLEALEAANMTRLKSLRVGSLHHVFFRPTIFQLNKIGPLLANLTRFEMVIETKMEESMEDSMNWDMSETEFCRETMTHGGLRELLRGMPNLELLAIMFAWQDEATDGYSYPASFSDLIPAGMHWPNLEHLKLEIIETDRQELLKFLMRHKETLLELYLKDIKLNDSSWFVLLPQLKFELGTTLMQDVLISGMIYGRHEDEMAQEDEEDEEMWELGDPEYDDDRHDCRVLLAEQLSEYLLRDYIHTLPLTRDNMFFEDDHADMDSLQ